MPGRREFLQQLVAAGAIMAAPALSYSRPSTALPNILILGDSISMGYTPVVQELLAGKAQVSRPMRANGKAENCEGTTKGVAKLEKWLAERQWDIIHFNFGLHDLKHVHPETGKNSKDPDHPQQAAPKQYRKNLKLIVDQLLQTKAQLIFATTTPYPDPVDGPLRLPGMPERYNRIARRIMRKNKIPINDLYAFVLPQMAALQRPANVHFTKEGRRKLGEQVSQKLLLYL